MSHIHQKKCIKIIIFIILILFTEFQLISLLPNKVLKSEKMQIYHPSPSSVADWNRTWGGVADDEAFDLIVDHNTGNITLTGYTLSYGAGSHDIVLVRYDNLGNQQWNVTWGGAESDIGRALAFDTDKNIYIAGYSNSSTSNGKYNITLLKFNSTHDLQWNKSWGGSNHDKAYGITIDSSNNIYVVGVTYNFGTGGDIVIIKFDSNGNLLWNRTRGNEYLDLGTDIVLDNDENFIYVSAYKLGYLGDYYYSVTLLKYDVLGNYDYSWGMNFGDDDYGYSVAIDSNNNIITSGTSIENSVQNIFVVKYSSEKVYRWHTIYTNYREEGFDMAIDSKDNIYVVGYSRGLIDDDIYMVKFNDKGTPVMYSLYGGGAHDRANAIALNSSNDIYIVGFTESEGSGGSDIFLIKNPETRDIYVGDDDDDNPTNDLPSFFGNPMLLLAALIIVGAIGGGIFISAMIIIKKKSNVNLHEREQKKVLPHQSQVLQPNKPGVADSRQLRIIPPPDTRPITVIHPKKLQEIQDSSEEKVFSLEAEEEAELEKTETEMDIEKQKFICIVHKGPIKGANIYLCPKCETIYCLKCAKTLKENGEKCWSCSENFEL